MCGKQPYQVDQKVRTCSCRTEPDSGIAVLRRRLWAKRTLFLAHDNATHGSRDEDAKDFIFMQSG